MTDCVQGGGHSPVHQISKQILVSMSATVSPPFFISSAGMLFIPAALPLFSVRVAASTSSRRIGWSFSFVIPSEYERLGLR